MAVDWRLGGGGFDASEVLQSFGQAQDQRLQAQRQQAALAAQQRQLQTAQQAGGLAAQGNFAGARNAALQAGDFDIAGHVSGLEDAHRKQLADRAQTVGALAVGLKGVPVADRAARFQALAPQLVQRGFDPQELAQVDLSDAGLDGYISFATSADDALKAYAKAQEPVVLSDGAQLFSRDGRMIAQNEKDAPKADWIFDSESGSWLQKPGTGQAGFPGALPGGAVQGGSVVSGGSRAARNNNPGNIMDGAFARSQPGYAGSGGRFARFSSADAGAGAQAALLGSYIDRGYNTVEKIIGRWAPPSENDTGAYIRNVARALNVNPGDVLSKASIPALQRIITRVEGGPGGSSAGTPVPVAGGPGVINVRAPKSRQENAPSGYRYNGSNLEPIPGGPADKTASSGGERKQETALRKEFNSRPEVKNFGVARQQFYTVRDLARKKNPTAQDDIAIIFGFMKTLDPGSTVREGEFATAQNAGSVPDNILNLYQRVQGGQRLNPQQRRYMAQAAYASYNQFRTAYNNTAENFGQLARRDGIDPRAVAPRAIVDQPRRSGSGIGVGQSSAVGGFKITRVK